ncbi:hypothetical protein GCM10012290_15560 [Halolactibacillus alkaliphilus]|uniref:Uncharacterized protein n=1 Tax=Halolactibacillus alkaliphilus TaxID=442899 RepID=A0A511X1H7_9BACI|nr:hypothetical protein [Halolactibacillus alkaliphilus]GEN56809.1 hypothetical protein HAL01_12730 [Halolactibacillus alkaliphilus]GGN71082.1 hypothetical protein GCM10012290_15560 [Halolactibacillus alkaliphilus]
MFFFLVGFGLMVQAGVMAILYLNVMPQPFNLMTYVSFITKQTSCQLFVVGVCFVFIGIKRLEHYFID